MLFFCFSFVLFLKQSYFSFEKRAYIDCDFHVLFFLIFCV
jgi:hypothetical protein